MLSWKKVIRDAIKAVVHQMLRPAKGGSKPERSSRRRRGPETSKASGPESKGYPGDFRGRVKPSYEPLPDELPDPGEVVWMWVPYEEDHSKGKDRPVLLIGRDGPWLLGLQLTSKDHDRDAAQEARAGRYWLDIGVGGWDRRGRESEVRVNRVLRVDPDQVRRIGARLDEKTFNKVAREVAKHR